MEKPLISKTRKAGNLLFLSGMTGGEGNTETQIRNIFEKIKEILEDAGASMDDVVSATVYLTDINDRSKHFNNIWREYFSENPPTRTCVEVGLAPPITAEMTVIASIPSD